ncbi:MAG TPA: ATP synthase F0 subunit B [Terriglobia bacterium]|nr:ATP synthase F0 subunit B [Terriglobia bacterium]
MRRVLRAGLLAVCLLGSVQVFSVPMLAAAPQAGKAEESGSNHELLLEIINFALLAGFLAYLYCKRGRAFFNERSETIRRSLEEGRRALEESQARLAEAEKKLAGLEDEIKAFRKQAEADIENEQVRIRHAAEDEARRIDEFAKTRIQAAANAAKLELKDYVVGRALEQARNTIRQRMDETNRERLVGYFLEDLSSKAKSN